MRILAFDTATAATAVALTKPAGILEARHDPALGERPGHASKVLELAGELLAAADVDWCEIDRVAVGTGPGSFTGLRIGVATARALAQAHGAAVTGVSTLQTLARGAASGPGNPAVVAVIDARRGEVFAAAWRGDECCIEPIAADPAELSERLTRLPAGTRVVGDGAIRFRAVFEPADVVVPEDGSPLHRVSARWICGLAANAAPTPLDALVPEYLRQPDADRDPRPAQ